MKIALIWCIANIQTSLRYSRRSNYLRIRYEDLILDHERTVKEIERRLSSHFKIPLTRIPYSKTTNTYRYAFAGNQMRETFTGDIEYDKRYIVGTNFINWCVISLCCLPALCIFKYPLSRKNCEKEFNNSNLG